VREWVRCWLNIASSSSAYPGQVGQAVSPAAVSISQIGERNRLPEGLQEIESAASQITVQGARYTEPSGSDFSAANLFMGVAVSRSRPSSPQCYRPSRNARTGSVRAARQAGKKQAANEAITSETDAMANGSGSRGLTL